MRRPQRTAHSKPQSRPRMAPDQDAGTVSVSAQLMEQPRDHRSHPFTIHSGHRRANRRLDIDGIGARHFRRRRDLPVSDLRQVGGRLSEGDRRRNELSIDRLRRRHQADSAEDGRIRRYRRPALGRRPRQEQPRPVPDGHGRHRSGRQSRWRCARRARHRWTRPGQDFSRPDQVLGRCRNSRRSIRA